MVIKTRKLWSILKRGTTSTEEHCLDKSPSPVRYSCFGSGCLRSCCLLLLFELKRFSFGLRSSFESKLTFIRNQLFNVNGRRIDICNVFDATSKPSMLGLGTILGAKMEPKSI